MTVFVMPPGGFAVLGLLIAASVAFEMRKRGGAEAPAPKMDACAGCQMCDLGAKEREA